MQIACPSCGEADKLTGRSHDDGITLACGSCGEQWERDLVPRCPTCGSDDMQTVPLAILERSRGTQLSVVGTRPISLCTTCDADKLARYHRRRPNPLMPDELPTIGRLPDDE